MARGEAAGRGNRAPGGRRIHRRHRREQGVEVHAGRTGLQQRPPDDDGGPAACRQSQRLPAQGRKARPAVRDVCEQRAEQEEEEVGCVVEPVVDEHMGFAEAPEQGHPRQRQAGRRQDDQLPAVQLGRHQAGKAGQPLTRAGRQQDQDERIGPQVGNEPEVVPGRHEQATVVVAEAAVAAQVQGHEAQVAAVEADIFDHLAIRLGRHHDQHPEQQRHEQAQAAPANEGGGVQASQGHGRGHAADQEQQAQAPWGRQQHAGLEARAGQVAFHVPVPADVVHAHVVQHEDEEGEDA